jgi:hypothetical protein
MLVVTYSEARQNLANMLNKALQDGEVLIKRNDGSMFSLKPFRKNTIEEWPGIESGLDREQILSALREGRERNR